MLLKSQINVMQSGLVKTSALIGMELCQARRTQGLTSAATFLESEGLRWHIYIEDNAGFIIDAFVVPWVRYANMQSSLFARTQSTQCLNAGSV